MHDGNGNNGHTALKRNSGGMAAMAATTTTTTNTTMGGGHHHGSGSGCGGGKSAGVCNDSVEAHAVDLGSSRDTEPGHSEASEVIDKQRVNIRLFFFCCIFYDFVG